MDKSRRKFLKKALYMTPVVLTAAVRPSFARSAYGGGNGQTPTVSSNGGSSSSASWWMFWEHV